MPSQTAKCRVSVKNSYREDQKHTWSRSSEHSKCPSIRKRGRHMYTYSRSNGGHSPSFLRRDPSSSHCYHRKRKRKHFRKRTSSNSRSESVYGQTFTNGMKSRRRRESSIYDPHNVRCSTSYTKPSRLRGIRSKRSRAIERDNHTTGHRAYERYQYRREQEERGKIVDGLLRISHSSKRYGDRTTNRPSKIDVYRGTRETRRNTYATPQSEPHVRCYRRDSVASPLPVSPHYATYWDAKSSHERLPPSGKRYINHSNRYRSRRLASTSRTARRHHMWNGSTVKDSRYRTSSVSHYCSSSLQRRRTTYVHSRVSPSPLRYKRAKPESVSSTLYRNAKRCKDRFVSYPLQSTTPANDVPSDSDITHFDWHPGMKLGKRFVVQRKLGEGTFGRVLECIDLRTRNVVAVKVVRDVSRYTRSAKIEADILKDIKFFDPEKRSNCVMLVDQYFYDSRRRRSCTSASAVRVTRKRTRPRRRGYQSFLYGSSQVSGQQKQCDDGVKSKKNYSSALHGESQESSCSYVDEYAEGVHMCLASEKLGLSLYAFLTENKYRGFFVADIKRIAFETLKALSFLRKIKLTHTDLKPENILFPNDSYEKVPFPRSAYPSRFWNGNCSDSELEDSSNSDSYGDNPSHRSGFRDAYKKSARSKKHFLDVHRHRSLVYTRRPIDPSVKLIDFGSATYEDDAHTTVINTRQYRAPEVIFQIGWSTPSDMWCLGCILVELYTGVLLFRTHEHFEHLALIEKIVAPFPQSMLRAVSRSPTAHYLMSRVSPDDRIRLDWPNQASSKTSVERVERCRRLESLFLPCHKPLADFVRFILEPDPSRRPTPKEALTHPFMSVTLPEA